MSTSAHRLATEFFQREWAELTAAERRVLDPTCCASSWPRAPPPR